ncbi:MAG TPA: hypothetical protein VLN49_11290 [Gemmatimonadaceae bacterium]|nr:hypothetical protein [Gemmatimonadaceae bacterium]
MTDSSSATSLPDAEIRRLVAAIAEDSAAAAEAWEALRPLGAAVVPYLAEAYTKAKRWRGRVALVFHAIRHARASEAAFQLGLQALGDRSHLVRYRACMVLAYALRPEALPALRVAAAHEDERTAEDARAAIDAIEHRNHHYFVDRDHSGRSYWDVNPGDTPQT